MWRQPTQRRWQHSTDSPARRASWPAFESAHALAYAFAEAERIREAGRRGSAASQPLRSRRQGRTGSDESTRGGSVSDRYADLFARLESEGRGAFVPFVVLG